MKKPKPSKPKVPQVSIRGETHAKVKEYCDKKGITVTSFIDKLCKEFLEL
uniref:Protein CopB n=1 Tax=viral metagenome TaxID=1070528 RepID=A0A6H1Z8Q3_9ZZZZ